MPAKKTQASHLDSLKDVVKRVGGMYLSEQEKLDIAGAEMPLTFTRIEKTKSKFGYRWECEFQHDKKRRVLTIPDRPEREEMMTKLAAIVKKNKVVGPLILTVSESADGERKFFWFKVA